MEVEVAEALDDDRTVVRRLLQLWSSPENHMTSPNFS
jgi:hypothetical protein